ncbi:tRNA (guanine46-N7-)-methyltransferase [Raoultella ornithinolytica]|nr:tRNA (guanine46-N7-)-methyltransferase [Raoultella ornithinolytica]
MDNARFPHTLTSRPNFYENDVISPEFDENGRPLRRIRSFVRRQGRLTKGQQHALDNIWPVMGVEFNDAPLDFAALFGRNAPTTLEIGFRHGRFAGGDGRKRSLSRISSVSKFTHRASVPAWPPPKKRVYTTCA